MHLDTGWTEKDTPDPYLKSGEKEVTFLGYKNGEVFKFGQPLAHCCLQMQPSKDAASDFGHSLPLVILLHFHHEIFVLHALFPVDFLSSDAAPYTGLI